MGQIFTSHSWRFGKCRYGSKSCGALVPRRPEYGSHCRAKLCTKTRVARQGLNRKEICRSKYDMHKIKWTNRVKGKNLILKLWAGLEGSPGSKTVQEKLATIQQNMSEKTNVFKIECCGSYGQLPTERTKQKVCRFLSGIGSKKSLRSCSQ